MALRKSTSTDEADFVLIVNGDGTLAVLTTLRDQEVTAWSLCTTDGDFLAVGVDQSDMYFATERSINGVTVRYLELFNSDMEVDCGVAYATGSPLTALSGLDHLNGEVVKVVADDAVLSNETVAAGSITPDRSVEATAQVGLDFSPLIRNMPIVLPLPDGTHMDRKKRIPRIMMELYQTSDILVDGERPAFRQFGGAGAGSPLDAAITPYTGRKIIDGRLGWDDLGQVDITQEFPVPMTLLSMELQVEI